MQHDCVILPGLGGFVANYKPAEFDTAHNTASPPSKHILFNRNLVHNDGLLYAHISKESGYGYKDVQKLAESFIEGIQKDIKKGIKFNIDGLGYFYPDKEGQVQFKEEGENNFLLGSYGLPFLKYKEIEKSSIDSYRANLQETDILARQRKIRKWAYGAAAACILAAMIIVPMRTGYFNQASIEIPGIDSFRRDKDVQIERLTDSPQSTLSTLYPVEPVLPEPEYNIVVGSFKDFTNARNLRSQLVEKGFDSRILGTEKGWYRVTAGTYSSSKETNVELAFVMADYENAWILSN